MFNILNGSQTLFSLQGLGLEGGDGWVMGSVMGRVGERGGAFSTRWPVFEFLAWPMDATSKFEWTLSVSRAGLRIKDSLPLCACMCVCVWSVRFCSRSIWK